MTISAKIAQMEADLSSVGVTVKALCEEAGVNQSTWTRWKAGSHAPLMETWGKVCETYERIMDAPQAKAS